MGREDLRPAGRAEPENNRKRNGNGRRLHVISLSHGNADKRRDISVAVTPM
jgi:hypothetical protein